MPHGRAPADARRAQPELPGAHRPPADVRAVHGREHEREVLHERVRDRDARRRVRARDVHAEQERGEIDRQAAHGREHEPADERERRGPRRPVGVRRVRRDRPRLGSGRLRRERRPSAPAGAVGASSDGSSADAPLSASAPPSLGHPVPGGELGDEEDHQQHRHGQQRALQRAGVRRATPPARWPAGTARRGSAGATSAAAARRGRRAAARARRARRRRRRAAAGAARRRSAGHGEDQEGELHQVVPGARCTGCRRRARSRRGASASTELAHAVEARHEAVPGAHDRARRSAATTPARRGTGASASPPASASQPQYSATPAGTSASHSTSRGAAR